MSEGPLSESWKVHSHARPHPSALPACLPSTWHTCLCLGLSAHRAGPQAGTAERVTPQLPCPPGEMSQSALCSSPDPWISRRCPLWGLSQAPALATSPSQSPFPVLLLLFPRISSPITYMHLNPVSGSASGNPNGGNSKQLLQLRGSAWLTVSP